MDIALKLAVILFSFMFVAACSGGVKILGIKDGKLSPCPGSPNCVVSQDADKKHYIDPIAYIGDRDEAFANLRTILISLKQAKIIKETNDYMHVEFTSKLFKFVDDVEFYFPEGDSVIHIRSASRVGYSDMGANRKRMENIRSLFQSSK